MKKQYPLSQILKYKFDNIMSKGPIAMIGLLALASIFLILIIGILMWIFNVNDGEPMGLIESLWQSLMATLDPGTMGGDSVWPFRIFRFLVTIGGIFIISTLIGVLGSGLQEKLDELRKGRSKVLENDHTLILGWSPKIFYIIDELVIANASRKEAYVVIVANKDKVEMEDMLRDKCKPLKNTKLICRTGNTSNADDLQIGSPDDARSIIILSQEDSTNPDAQILKTILALSNNPNRKKGDYHIVAELQDPKNGNVAKMVGKDEIEVILSDDVISSIMVQTCRQSGLSTVFTELLDYDGEDIYFHKESTLVGKNFQEITMNYDTSSVMGIARKNGSIILNPPKDSIYLDEDELIIISEDDSTIKLSTLEPIIQKEYFSNLPSHSHYPEKIMMLGWNKRALMVLEKMNAYTNIKHSIVLISKDTEEEIGFSEIQSKLSNMQISYQQGDITNRNLLDSLQLQNYDQIFLLSYSDELNEEDADAITLITLLHIRDISSQLNKHFPVASEMLNVNNKELAKIAKIDDFIVSENYISLILTQVSENKKVNKVFSQLFTIEGAEINIKPCTDYVQDGKPMTFHTVMKSAFEKDETAIGYKIIAQQEDAEKKFGIYLNPKKSETFSLTKEDKIIVLSNPKI